MPRSPPVLSVPNLHHVQPSTTTSSANPAERTSPTRPTATNRVDAERASCRSSPVPSAVTGTHLRTARRLELDAELPLRLLLIGDHVGRLPMRPASCCCASASAWSATGSSSAAGVWGDDERSRVRRHHALQARTAHRHRPPNRRQAGSRERRRGPAASVRHPATTWRRSKRRDLSPGVFRDETFAWGWRAERASRRLPAFQMVQNDSAIGVEFLDVKTSRKAAPVALGASARCRQRSRADRWSSGSGGG